MNGRLLTALLTGCFAAGTSVAAELPIAGPPPRLYYPGPLLPVEWTGFYFGGNAGYGWAKESSTIFFSGLSGGATTTPAALGGTGTSTSGLGVTELDGTDVVGSSSPRGGIAGGQLGFNWQWGRVVFGAEIDGQWSGQQATASVICNNCTATSTVKIKSLASGRARIGMAFDWILPYVTAGAALVNAQDNLAVTVGGITGNFQGLSGTSLGWVAGAGFDVALSSNLSARLEYLHINANGVRFNGPIPGILGTGFASESGGYRDDILRVGLNYRFGPRGGPGVLERPLSPNTFAINYDFLPSVAHVAEIATPAKPQQATAALIPAKAQQATVAPIRTADAAPDSTSIPIQPNTAIPSQPNPAKSAEPNSAKSAFKNFNEIGALDEGDTIALPKLSSKKPREREEDESQRLKRIMAICAGC
jgi:opacity protein-like surface antigen